VVILFFSKKRGLETEGRREYLERKTAGRRFSPAGGRREPAGTPATGGQVLSAATKKRIATSVVILFFSKKRGLETEGRREYLERKTAGRCFSPAGGRRHCSSCIFIGLSRRHPTFEKNPSTVLSYQFAHSFSFVPDCEASI